MRAFAVLGLVAAAQGSNLLYPKGCSDASKANYWPDNPDSEAECFPQATVYCPDPLADNYDAASRKLRPRTSRLPCPPCQPPLPSPARRASAHRLLAHWLVHTRARQTPGAAASPACPPTAAGAPAPATARATSPAIRLPGLAQTTVPQATAAQLTEPHAPFFAWQLPGAIPPIVPTSRMRWPLRPSARTTSMGAPTRSLPTTRASCRRPPAISGP